MGASEIQGEKEAGQREVLALAPQGLDAALKKVLLGECLNRGELFDRVAMEEYSAALWRQFFRDIDRNPMSKDAKLVE